MDGVYVKAGLEREKAAILVVMAALSDGSKVVVSAVPGYRESTRSWSEVLRDLRDRGLNCPRLVVGDGHLGIWGALRNVWPEAGEQRCWNHKILNVLDKLPKRQHDQARLMLRNIPYAETRAEAERLRRVFTRWCGDHSYEAARGQAVAMPESSLRQSRDHPYHKDRFAYDESNDSFMCPQGKVLPFERIHIPPNGVRYRFYRAPGAVCRA